VITVLKSLL